MAGSAKDRGSDGRYVVFCADGEDYGQLGYIFFTHEADVMMIAAAGEVESGKLTPAEARKLLEPYREVLPPLYTGEQQMVFDPGRRSWRDHNSFPSADDVQQSPQASQIFWYEVDDLGIEGATLVWSEPFPLLAPVSHTAFTRLMKAVSDEYEIVVKRDIDEFDAMGKSVDWAMKLIADAKSTAEISYTQVRDPFGVELVYGNGGGRFSLVFLEEDYAEEIRDLRTALRSAATWGELRNMVRKKRYRETVEILKDYENVSPPNPEDDFDAESLPGYADGDWPEFAPNAMGRWVDEEIIYEYGWYTRVDWSGARHTKINPATSRTSADRSWYWSLSKLSPMSRALVRLPSSAQTHWW